MSVRVRRYANEYDCSEWSDRLHITGADFRLLPAFLEQVQTWANGPAFDILINNAAQTVWHPPEYYAELRAAEASSENETVKWLTEPANPTGQMPEIFPARTRSVETIDFHRTNSWVQRLGEIDPVEMIEVQVVNNIAPFILCNELRANMLRANVEDRYIINVSALEGQFNRLKSPRHPHTNMAKAALNMLTRTAAEGYAKDGIYMTSVDPGWMSHEGPQQFKDRAEAHGFHPPLEAIDCAARIFDPIASGISGKPVHGVLLKDFRVTPW